MKNFKFSVLVGVIFSFLATKANGQYLQDVSGRTMPLKSYTDIEGSAYLSDDWQKGNAKISSGQVFTNLDMKLNEYEDKLYFKGKAGEVLEFVDPVTGFSIYSANGAIKQFVTNVSLLDNKPAYYQVIADGSVALLKQLKKDIFEKKEYNSATVVKSFIDNSRYFLRANGKLLPVKKDKKSLLTAIGNKQPELEGYIKSNSLNLKNDDDLAKSIIYYNSL